MRRPSARRFRDELPACDPAFEQSACLAGDSCSRPFLQLRRYAALPFDEADWGSGRNAATTWLTVRCSAGVAEPLFSARSRVHDDLFLQPALRAFVEQRQLDRT